MKINKPPTVIIILILLDSLLYSSGAGILGIPIELLAYSLWFAYDYESKREDN